MLRQNNIYGLDYTLRNQGYLVTLFFSLIFFACTVFASPNNDNSGKLIEYLSQEKMSLSLAISETKTSEPPIHQADYLKKLQENDAKIALNHAKIASFESFLINQKKIQLNFSLKIKQLQQFPADKSPQVNMQEKIEQINALNEINKKTIDLINNDLKLANQYQNLLLEEKHALDLWKAKQEMHEHLEASHVQEDKLNVSLQKLFENSLKLQHEIKAQNNFKSSYSLEARLLLNNQIISLTQYKIAEVNLQRRLAKADYLLLKTPDIRTLQTVTDIYKSVINQLSDIEQALKKILFILKKDQPRILDSNLKQQFSTLIRIINARIASIGIQEQTLQEDLENHQLELKKQLSVRQSLSEYRLGSWPSIMSQLSQMPNQFYNYLKSLILKIRDNYLWQDTLPIVLIWGTVIALALGFSFLYYLFKRLTRDKARSRLSGHLYDGALIILSKNLPHLLLLSLLFVVFYLNNIPYSNYQLLFNLIFVWVTFRTLILIARLGLMERLSDVTGKDVRLFYRIKWLLLTGGWITGLMVFSHQLPLPLLLQDIFNRLFMLFLLAVSIVIWKSREVIHHILHPFLKTKKRYLRNAIMLLLILTPLTLFGIALIGLVGYINLAWSMSSYQVQILLIITAYVLLRGLLFDALELVSELMISSLSNGWLWIEVILKPLDKILRILLFFLSLYALSKLFDWGSSTTLYTHLKQIGEYPIINLTGIYITSISIIEFIILSSIFLWVSKWTREFCYRWLYRDARDPGIRNSLSVFTQYAIILIGGFITLRVLGFDFSGMSMVIGGLAVGMGFGLRDFASNIVGGLMLLIERPVREGDLITLGGYEGRVSHIGIRSMRVSSWDNMEVLIPNAETFNKPFTNWTHQDNIIRTVVPIRISRVDDPLMVQQLILDVLAIIPEIVDDPPPQVFLAQIDDALINFEIRYFINIQINTRFEIRSKVLFAIMAQFKAAGVKPPIPPISVELPRDQLDAIEHFFPDERK